MPQFLRKIVYPIFLIFLIFWHAGCGVRALNDSSTDEYDDVGFDDDVSQIDEYGGEASDETTDDEDKSDDTDTMADEYADGSDDTADNDNESEEFYALAPSDWMSSATIAGLSTNSGMHSEELTILIEELATQHTTVVEFDSSLSNYMSDDDFANEVRFMRKATSIAHKKGMRAVWYYPAFEVITCDGETSSSSMYKDHPGWVQTSIDGTPNVFYGSRAFWVLPGEESAWMDPLTPYRTYYLQRVRQIAASGVDGLWLDVPLYNNIVGLWTSHTPEQIAKFMEDTGLDLPETVDASNPAWWVWLRWRHQIIDAFLQDVLAAAREINPDFSLIVETVTMDYNGAILQGLDGSYAGPRDGLLHVWEIDVVSETNSMVYAKYDDWTSLIAMYKYGRGADLGRPAWAFSYGNGELDAQLVMAVSIASQVNPYELKAPAMATTVGSAFRHKMFSWVQENSNDIFKSQSAAKIAVLHSSSSRDYLDGLCLITGECGSALFATWETPDPSISWWAYGSERNSVYYSNYMAEYRGIVKALVNLHKPFDIIPLSLVTEDKLDQYDTVILPFPTSVSDTEAQLINNYAMEGGHLLVTGPNAGQRNEVAALRSTNAFTGIADIPTEPETCLNTAPGTGKATYCNYELGKSYLVTNSTPALTKIADALTEYSADILETNADRNIFFSIYKSAGKILLHIVNYSGGNGNFAVLPQTFHISLDTSNLARVSKIVKTSPDEFEKIELPFTASDLRADFDITVNINELVIISE